MSLTELWRRRQRLKLWYSVQRVCVCTAIITVICKVSYNWFLIDYFAKEGHITALLVSPWLGELGSLWFLSSCCSCRSFCMFPSLHLMFDSLLRILQWAAFHFLMPVEEAVAPVPCSVLRQVNSDGRITSMGAVLQKSVVLCLTTS